MKNIAIILSLLTLTILIYSCKKDKDTEQTKPIVYPNYSQFKVGSYWIYQHFDIDSSGKATPTNIFDSCYVMKDTIINNQTYLKTFRSNPNNPYFNYSIERDSLHYIISYDGIIRFSSQDFQTIFHTHYHIDISNNDTICLTIAKMEDKDLVVNTPAGSFVTSDYRITYFIYPKYAIAGNTRIRHTRYAENIGIVLETLESYISTRNCVERRLVRYHIN